MGSLTGPMRRCLCTSWATPTIGCKIQRSTTKIHQSKVFLCVCIISATEVGRHILRRDAPACAARPHGPCAPAPRAHARPLARTCTPARARRRAHARPHARPGICSLRAVSRTRPYLPTPLDLTFVPTLFSLGISRLPAALDFGILLGIARTVLERDRWMTTPSSP